MTTSNPRPNPVLLVLAMLATLLCAPEAGAVATCTVSASAVAYAPYNPFATAADDSTGDIAVSCSLGGLLSLLVGYDIALSTGGAGSYVPRTLSSGASTLNYNLYTTSGRTTVWGDGTGGTATISDGYLLGLGTTVRHYTVYGRVPAQQNVRGGSYTDTIVVTVTY